MQKWRDQLTAEFKANAPKAFAKCMGIIVGIVTVGWIIGRIGGWY